MARSILTNTDFNKNELLNARIQNLASAPGSPVEGQIYYDTALDKLRVYNALLAAWVNLDGSDIPDGTITSAKIADGAIMNIDINASAGIVLSKLATDPLARANHTGTQAPATITFAATDRLLGRDTTGAGVGEELTATGGIEFTGTGIQTSAFTGDVTKTAGGLSLTIAANAVTTAKILDANVTNAKLANMANATIKGRATAGTGVPEDLTAAQVKTILAIVPGDVSGFDTQVRTSRLDQMAAPTADVAFNNRKITGLAEPISPTDGATKNYVDLARQGIRMKDSVLVATLGAITLSGEQTIDGVLTSASRVLVKAQASSAANGIYVSAAGAWTRSTDADIAAELNDGATVWVSQGTTLANSTWSQTETITTLGTDPQTWVQQGSATSYIGGNGLVLTGNTFDVVGGTGITVTADAVSVDIAVVARKYNTTVGDGAATTYVITHSLSNQWCTVQVFRNSGAFDQIECDIELTSANTATLRFAVAPTSAQFRVVVTG